MLVHWSIGPSREPFGNDRFVPMFLEMQLKNLNLEALGRCVKGMRNKEFFFDFSHP